MNKICFVLFASFFCNCAVASAEDEQIKFEESLVRFVSVSNIARKRDVYSVPIIIQPSENPLTKLNFELFVYLAYIEGEIYEQVQIEAMNDSYCLASNDDSRAAIFEVRWKNGTTEGKCKMKAASFLRFLTALRMLSGNSLDRSLFRIVNDMLPN